MNELNIPIYRAKKVDSDEYIQGYLAFDYQTKEYFIEVEPANHAHIVDPTTIAIHFPDMLDNEDSKIFASLSEDGKGGDVVKIEAFLEIYQKANVVYKDGRILIRQEEDEIHMRNKDIEALEITVSEIKE